MSILGISKLLFNFLGIRFSNSCFIFEIAWIALVCVDVILKNHVFFIFVKSLPENAPYPNAYAKVKKWIFDVEFSENWFEFDII